ncbi:hypothetical protein OBBRIDRAFT_817191 [Obba rivulosa]|uniref:Uncharacterized protein n=1 Tax=Obba rivulosa TaxID=1052685 RepID=A0A8E2J4P9_9APHY|nr:hypothetical protein OBBRIDRAFT_817191 [Obba rivulosa]
MVFGFFTKKQSAAANIGSSSPSAPQSPSSKPGDAPASPSNAPIQLRTPSPSVESASVPRGTHGVASPATRFSRLSVEEQPREPLLEGDSALLPLPSTAAVPPEATVASLTGLLASIPPKIFHAYTMSKLPSAPESTLATLASFYTELTPPPRLHCVRCHKDFVEVENDDRSCLVPHDDESAEVERIGVSKSSGRSAVGTTFQTLWGCCGKIVEGDGDQGPPDGWCYEGKHTTDIKRARFRADSTSQNDKLVSCLRLNCHGVRAQLPHSSARSTRKRPRANLREASTDEDASAGEPDSGMEELATKHKGKGKGKGKEKMLPTEDERMDVDQEAEETTSKAGSARGRKRGRPSAASKKDASSAPAAKRKGRPPKSKAAAADTDADEAPSAPTKPTPPVSKRRGRAPKSKQYVEDSDAEEMPDMNVVPKSVSSPGRGPRRTRSISRTRASAGEKDKDEEVEKPKKKRKVAA